MLFSHKFSFFINTIFPPLLKTPYAGHVKFFAEASEFFARASRRQQIGVLEGAKKIKDKKGAK